MKFKGKKGLIIGGIEFEEDFLETDDPEIIDKLFKHSALNLFYSIYEPPKKSKTKTVIPPKEGSREAKIKMLEERGTELRKLTNKELIVMAQGYGYAGDSMSKDDTIIWILKAEEELGKGVTSEG